MKAKKVKKIKHPSLKALHKKAWALQSEYIRRYEKGQCFTCGIRKPWKELQLGHYIHKDCLDFDSLNLHAQCSRCNKWLHGNSGNYAERLIAEYGEDAISRLRTRSEEIKKFTIGELENYILDFQQKLKDLKDEA